MNGRNNTRRRNLNKTAPVKIPLFHYTRSQERRAWTCAVYPHAETFLRLPGAIDWSAWSYEQDGLKAKYNTTPYYALGGSVEEIYNILYKRDILPGEELHKRVDPTADLDIRICPLTLSNIRGRTHVSYYSSGNSKDIVLYPWFESAVNWLVDQVVAYFRPLERKLNSMFPSALPFIKEYDSQSKDARRIERVGPLTIIHTTSINGSKPLTKVQVKLTIPKPNLIARAASSGRNMYSYTNDMIQDHMVEFGFWESPDTNRCAHDSFIYRPYSLRVRDLKGEIYGCFSGLGQRLELIYHPSLIHKCVNYIYRLRFLLKILYSVWNKVRKNRPNAYGIDDETLQTIGKTLENILDYVYNQTRNEKRNSIWFVFYEIARILDKPITDYMDITTIERRSNWYIEYIYKEYTPEQKREIEARIGTTDSIRVKMEIFRINMDATKYRYIFNKPIGCNEPTPEEVPLVEEEKKRRAATMLVPRGPTLAELEELPELERDALLEEQRGQPVRKVGR